MRYIRVFGLLGLLIGLMVFSVDCKSAPKPLETEANFTGWVIEIHQIEEKGIEGELLVESQVAKVIDKYLVTITDETLIFRQDGENHRHVTFNALKATQQVKIWFSGPILQSFPKQGTAQQVVITSKYGE